MSHATSADVTTGCDVDIHESHFHRAQFVGNVANLSTLQPAASIPLRSATRCIEVIGGYAHVGMAERAKTSRQFCQPLGSLFDAQLAQLAINPRRTSARVGCNTRRISSRTSIDTGGRPRRRLLF